MDSMMIESNIRKLSRMELIYTCISGLASHVNKAGEDVLPDDLKHYTEPDDYNKVIYHQRSIDSDSRMKQLLSDADRLLKLCEQITMSQQNMSCLSDVFLNRQLQKTVSGG